LNKLLAAVVERMVTQNITVKFGRSLLTIR